MFEFDLVLESKMKTISSYTQCQYVVESTYFVEHQVQERCRCYTASVTLRVSVTLQV